MSEKKHEVFGPRPLADDVFTPEALASLAMIMLPIVTGGMSWVKNINPESLADIDAYADKLGVEAANALNAMGDDERDAFMAFTAQFAMAAVASASRKVRWINFDNKTMMERNGTEADDFSPDEYPVCSHLRTLEMVDGVPVLALDLHFTDKRRDRAMLVYDQPFLSMALDDRMTGVIQAKDAPQDVKDRAEAILAEMMTHFQKGNSRLKLFPLNPDDQYMVRVQQDGTIRMPEGGQA